MTTYYPWKVGTLKAWLNSEMCRKRAVPGLADDLGVSALATDLKIQDRYLWGWLTGSLELITLEQLQRIARYRGLSIYETVQWLGICSAHLEDLVEACGKEIEIFPLFLNTHQRIPAIMGAY